MQKWRWDQGRLNYFLFDNMKCIAKCLDDAEGAPLGAGSLDPLRSCLTTNTKLTFPPNNAQYKVWRNFGRIFERCLLATSLNNTLAVTDLCKRLAASDTVPVDVDEYLSFWIPRAYNPSPASEGYDPNAAQYFPFCAVLKYLFVAFQEKGTDPSISLDDVFSLIIGNDCTGREPLQHYKNLPHTGYSLVGDEKRQVREALIFISQSSFLKWHNNRLYIDILPGDTESANAFGQMFEPLLQSRQPDRAKEILALGKNADAIFNASASSARRQPADVLFTEGKRVRVTHLRTERSPYLREAFFKSQTKPYRCNMCDCDPKKVYPWTDNILEVHHLLPLCSTLIVTTTGTSLADVVGLCPNCHKSVHTYYKRWLNRRSIEDFRSSNEAKSVYIEAKGQIQL